MKDAHATLTLRAAYVAGTALRAIQSIRPLLGPPNGEVSGFEEAIEVLRSLYRPPKPRPPRPKRPPKPWTLRKPSPAPKVVLEEEPDEQPSAWDPEPLYEASRCQALLMEIIRRAAHDWVLYRQHRQLELKALAEQAHTWLFEEEPGHPAWRDRERAIFKVDDGSMGQTIEVGSRRLTSFLSICEACNLDPEAVRDRAREMTVESIMRTGRHIERRKPRPGADSMSIESHSIVVDIDLDSLDAESQSGYHDYDSHQGYGSDNHW